MISIGARVQILRAADEFFDEKFENLVGTVVRREVGTGVWPVGEKPTDPLYIVKTVRGVDAFWSEELKVVL